MMGMQTSSINTTHRTPAKALPNGLSKSRFLLGAQCHRLLWWTAHDAHAPELMHDAATDVIFEQGHLVGEEARRRFPAGALVDLPHKDIDGRIARTRELIDAGALTIFEACFIHDGVFVAVDVLDRSSTGEGGGPGSAWDLIEVKCTTRVKDEHLLDTALQRHVVISCGVDVRRVVLMHLSRDCAFPDLTNLFELADVTEAAVGLEAHVAHAARAQRAMLARAEPPAVDTGDHCSAPRDCPFFARCHAAVPEHHISTLYAIGEKAQALAARGIETLHDVDHTVRLSAIAARQVSAVKSDRVIVEPELTDELASLEGPLAFFDLETVAFAIPRHDGCRPWDGVPAQASIHIETLNARGAPDVVHHAHLADADPSIDPRPALARFVIEHTRGARTILAWNASFERRCLREIGAAFPDLAEELDDVCARIVDLLTIVRRNVYHPAFHGSFSLKSVAPALVPGFTYGDLDIAGGGAATAALFRLFVDDALVNTSDERAALRAALLAYCAQDTLALVHILSTLRCLVRSRAQCIGSAA